MHRQRATDDDGLEGSAREGELRDSSRFSHFTKKKRVATKI